MFAGERGDAEPRCSETCAQDQSFGSFSPVARYQHEVWEDGRPSSAVGQRNSTEVQTMTYPNDPYATGTTPNPNGSRPPRDGGGGLYALIGAAVIAALVVVAFVVGAFDTDTPTGATADRPAVTQPANPQAPGANPALPPAGTPNPPPAQ
jgi:hypothetical protein